MPLPPISLYIHIPWCIKKCPYCDFNSHAQKTDLPEQQYVDALLIDLATDIARYQVTRPLTSIFFGGGTPSLFSAEAIQRLLQGIAQQLTFAHDIEITLEANPSTFEQQKFADFRAIGINRLSIGVQSFNERLLKQLGRVHSGQEARIAAEMAQQVGFTNFNLDLMFGLPTAKPADSLADITTAIALQPTHISFYQLTLEPNTYFYQFPPSLPSDSSIFVTQQRCQDLLALHGYAQYEVSAYSQANRQCRHNRNYWQFGDYLGIGAGAHGKISLALPSQIIRSSKTKHPQHYLQDGYQNGNAEVIDIAQLPIEFLMNHLRLKQGFSIATYQAMTGLNAETLEPALSDCVKQGLLIQQEQHYHCSAQGWHFLDTILEKFLHY